ncbi:HNH endonuclease [Domibacillus tundrae]|uniref:HNH endonuclease n=1 Tax=Domibacillus tundrae TaxID=1587527 RepID=UPI000695C570|nr:HNH endonuclease [Domibacillus tundrae]
MGIGRIAGKGAGWAAGSVLGGAVKLAGKATKQDWLEEAGTSVKNASTSALETAGQLIDGGVGLTAGAIRKDEEQKKRAMNDVKESAGRTVKGVAGTVKYSAVNAAEVVKGAASGDRDQAISGLKNLGKVVVTATVAVGVIDLMDGMDTAEAIETRNDHLNGFDHAETGVPFVEKTVEMPDGQVVEGTFPVFSSVFDVYIAEESYLQSDAAHFGTANEALYAEIVRDPGVATQMGFGPQEVGQLSQGETPDGYTWHHSEEPGLLQLVDQETHHETGHTGGRELWGGGEAHR